MRERVHLQRQSYGNRRDRDCNRTYLACMHTHIHNTWVEKRQREAGCEANGVGCLSFVSLVQPRRDEEGRRKFPWNRSRIKQLINVRHNCLTPKCTLGTNLVVLNVRRVEFRDHGVVV
ncbi:hypothetical protein KQX54_004190 [Cotesia glomerata]|uniref:Uncharacterized protein n=1 Tax=Cotesia glomerata TaxID=32391 RepID=A0AAV7I6V3_COTGL|nr:hypothetical protein KQX54_004190 [Cotesia glomerata]